MTQDFAGAVDGDNLTAKYNDKNNFGTSPYVALFEVSLAVTRHKRSAAYSASLSYLVVRPPSLPGGTDMRDCRDAFCASAHPAVSTCNVDRTLQGVLMRTLPNPTIFPHEADSPSAISTHRRFTDDYTLEGLE